MNIIPDISEIGEFVYSWDFDAEEYNEYLQENGLDDSQEELMNYIEEQVSFDVDFLDNVTYHTFDSLSMSLDEIREEYGDKLADTILKDCMNDGEGRIETELIIGDEDIDLNNDTQVNAVAKKLFQHGDYYKDCRGFILTDGTVIYTPNEHNECTRINGVKGTFDFLMLGNIRVLPNSIDIGKKPTSEQREVLMKVINCYSDDTLYLDIMDNGKEIGTRYDSASWKYVLGQIDRYYREGIKPTGNNNFYESKNMVRKLIITEEKEQELIGDLLEEAFYPTSDKVLLIKNYLDKNFARQELDSLDSNGYPIKEKTVTMLSRDKQPLKTLQIKELLMLLDDKFHKMISDDNDRKKFLKQVITDWYARNIKANGILSVNHL